MQVHGRWPEIYEYFKKKVVLGQFVELHGLAWPSCDSNVLREIQLTRQIKLLLLFTVVKYIYVGIMFLYLLYMEICN